VGAGDEVITSPFTFVATVEAISLLGAKPVFADIDPLTFNLDPADAERKITDKTRAILPVHLYGQPADIGRFSRLAESHDLRLIWDGAQAIGSEYDGKSIGAYPDALTLSFYPTKNLGGAGDGGMIVTSDGELAEKVRYLRFHGSAGSYSYKYVGYCSRLDEIQAAILRVKMPHLKAWNEARRRNARAYRGLLGDLEIELPTEAVNCKHTYHQFTIRSTRRDELKNYLKSLDIDTGVFYPTPLHLEEAYRYLGCTEGDYLEAEKACREVLSLPVFPELTADQLRYVATSIRSFLTDRSST
jgi:dTDP-4-amino-4,6-dideoxygalactose transaminase